jgi:Methyltransferase domain
VSEARIRADELMRRVKVERPIGAEIGVAIGQMSECLLLHRGLTLYMVDSWEPEAEQPQHYLDSGDRYAHCTPGEVQAHLDTAFRVTEFAAERRKILRMRSVLAANTIADDYLDFVFIDADHSYRGASEDIAAWEPKVKRGGVLGGHDYGHARTKDEWTWGPKQAVDEAVAENGWTLERGENFTWFVRL